MGVEDKKVKLLLNKPVYIEQTILDLSKLVNKYLLGCFIHLNYDIAKYKNMFDLSNNPVDHPLHDDVNKKTVLEFKNETGNL